MQRRLRGALLVSIVATLFQSMPAGALVKFDFEQKFFNEPGQPVLDHCIVEMNGVYHLFYLRGNPALSVGHATSQDLVHWTLKPPILTPGTWDTKLWAPHVIPDSGGGGWWWMFYTGVNAVASQQTGIAWSTDLSTWWQYPNPVYNPDPVWAEWSETYFTHGRDPHVIEHNGQYYLFNTAKTWTNRGAVACAVSDNLLTWTDIGPVYVHYTWHVLESIFIMEHGGKFHMFFTEEGVNGTSHMPSDSLLSGWDILANRRIIDLGHAPQVFTSSGGADIFSRHQVYNDRHGGLMYTIRLDTLRWFGDVPGPSLPWALAANWTAVDGGAFSPQPTFMNNPWVRGEDVQPSYEGQSWIGTKERYTGPLGFGLPGAQQGEIAKGTIRSRVFSIGGYSMNLLVGGSDDIDQCYVALVENASGKILFKETGRGVEEMDRRYWDLLPHVGKSVYIEIADQSDAGHINVDDIRESGDPISTATGTGKSRNKPGLGSISAPPADATVVLHQNVPNPFNPATTISFELPSVARVTLDVFDVNGKLIRRLVDEEHAPGLHHAAWNGRDARGASVASGVYFYRLTVDGGVVLTRKMALLK